MPVILIVAFLVEITLIVFTALFLLQPQFLFQKFSSRAQNLSFGAGMMSLCLTFCWSVVLGILLQLNGITIQL